MKIGFIGAGKVGFSLGRFFVQGGIPVTGYCSRHRGSAEEAARFTGTRCYDDMETLVRESDAIFLTVPDGSIPAVFARLRDSMPLTGKQICHCSGAMTAREAFPGAEDTCAGYYSIHPLFPISDRYAAYRELTGAFFCLEGRGPHLPRWESLLSSLGGRVRRIPSEGKTAYHAACAMASNLVCALAQGSVTLLEGCGFSRREALAALAPLMRANLDHILAEGPVPALTGPVERGDTVTVKKHLDCLSPGPLEGLYRQASLVLASMAEEKHPEENRQSVKTLLEEGSKR